MLIPIFSVRSWRDFSYCSLLMALVRRDDRMEVMCTQSNRRNWAWFLHRLSMWPSHGAGREEINENAHTEQNLEEYQKRFHGYEERFDTLTE